MDEFVFVCKVFGTLMFFDDSFDLLDPLAFLFKSLDGDEMFLFFELVLKSKRVLIFLSCVGGGNRQRENESESERKRKREREITICVGKIDDSDVFEWKGIHKCVF